MMNDDEITDKDAADESDDDDDDVDMADNPFALKTNHHRHTPKPTNEKYECRYEKEKSNCHHVSCGWNCKDWKCDEKMVKTDDCGIKYRCQCIHGTHKTFYGTQYCNRAPCRLESAACLVAARVRLVPCPTHETTMSPSKR